MGDGDPSRRSGAFGEIPRRKPDRRARTCVGLHSSTYNWGLVGSGPLGLSPTPEVPRDHHEPND
jgi:hypothetical protein